MSSIYLVFDKKAGLYSAPLTLLDDSQALSWFDYVLKNEDSKSDYELYKIADYDEKAGKLNLLETPSFLVCLTDKPIEEFVGDIDEK